VLGRRPYLRALAVLVAAALPCGIASAASPPTATPPPCGDSTLATVSSVVGYVATNIYRGELAGGEVAVDQRHVTQSAALLRAVAKRNSVGVYSALHALVYHPLWHIVRLRVLDTSGHVLGDIGGPYVIAPVSGVLRLNGHVIGSYLMSVQDDYGFTLLESHAVGDPIAIYYRGKNVADTGGPLPPSQPAGPTMMLDGVSYTVLTLTYDAFPTGTLTAVILVPPPAPSLAAQPCVAVRAIEIGHIAKLLSERFHPLDVSYARFVEVVHSDTGATVILRIGPRALPGSEGIGPAVIPNSGPLTYLGRNYWVVSLTPTPPARIYLLVSVPATPAPGT
jgi:hypothetical protein